MLPEEDLPPSWLRDYGQIEADVARMEEFAVKLRGEVEGNYAPHLDSVYADMLVELPTPPAQFGELSAFILAHHETSQTAANNTFHFRDATGGFAIAAEKVSQQYRNVERALDQTAAVAPTPTFPDGSAPAGTVPVGEGPAPLPPGVM